MQQQLQALKERYGADNFTVDELDDDDPILRDRRRRHRRHLARGLSLRGADRAASTRARSGCCRSSCSSCRSGSSPPARDRSFSSRAETPRARAAPSSGSWSISIPRRAHGGAGEAHRLRVPAVVLPALHPAPARGRRNDLFDRSWYTRAGVERVMGFCTDTEYARFLQQAPIFEDCWSGGLHADQVLVLGVPLGAEHPLPDPADRPGPPVEAVADGSGLPGQVGRLHRGQGRHVHAHRHGHRAVDGDQEQRQEAGSAQCDAARAGRHRLRRQGPRGGRQAGSADRRPGRRHPGRRSRAVQLSPSLCARAHLHWVP